MNEINVQDITKDYGNGKGIFHVSFQIGKGEVIGYLGPNGAGKTTTIRQLMGFMRPDQGKLTIHGYDCFSEADKIRHYLGYLPGEISFFHSMSGKEFIKFVAGMKKMKGTGRAHELMERFQLDPSGKISKMSKGMKQKIGLVCAFMSDPEILILDEPTSGLDPLMQNEFVNLILDEKKRGKTIFMSSHIFEEVEKTCDRAVIIRNGELVAVENMETLKQGRQKKLEIQFQTEKEAKAFAGIIDCKIQDPFKVICSVKGSMDRVIKEAAKYTVQDMNIRSQSLEEFFLHFYGGTEK